MHFGIKFWTYFACVITVTLFSDYKTIDFVHLILSLICTASGFKATGSPYAEVAPLCPAYKSSRVFSSSISFLCVVSLLGPIAPILFFPYLVSVQHLDCTQRIHNWTAKLDSKLIQLFLLTFTVWNQFKLVWSHSPDWWVLKLDILSSNLASLWCIAQPHCVDYK